MAVRAKFYVAAITKQAYSPEGAKVTLRATKRKEGDNKGFWDATPNGTLEMDLSAKGGAAAKWFEERLGQDVYLTFEEAEPGEIYSHEHAAKSNREYAEMKAAAESA